VTSEFEGTPQAEVAAARDEVATMKKKLEGALARKAVVENECRRYLKPPDPVPPSVDQTGGGGGAVDYRQRRGASRHAGRHARGGVRRTGNPLPYFTHKRGRVRRSSPNRLTSSRRECDVRVRLCSLKEKVQTLIEKTTNDDKLIDALKTELRKKPAASKPAAAPAPAATTTGRTGDSASGSSANFSVPVLEALERKTVEQQGQIMRQEKIILALQQQTAAPAPAGRQVLEVEKEKLEELVEMFRVRVEQAEAATADARACARASVGPSVVSERRQRNIHQCVESPSAFLWGINVRMRSVRRWCVWWAKREGSVGRGAEHRPGGVCGRGCGLRNRGATTG